jgi:hypothetical protein
LGVFGAFDRVVDDEQVGAATGGGTPDPDCDHPAGMAVEVPTMRRGGIGTQAHPEQASVLFEDVADPTTPRGGEV